MSRIVTAIFSFVIAALPLIAACEKRDPLSAPSDYPPLEGATVRLSGLSGCETPTSSVAVSGQDRLHAGEKDGKVSFEHSGAVFNCCMDSISISILSIKPGVVRVLETEHTANACRCNCNYTVFGEITGLEGGMITIEVASATAPEKILGSRTFCIGCDTIIN